MRVLILYFLSFVSLCYKSQITFDKKYDFGDSSGAYLSTSIFKDQNDYLLTGIATSSVNSINSFGIIKTDSIGAQKWQKIIFGHNNQSLTNNSANQFFTQLRNKNILITGQLELNTAHTLSFLARVNHLTGDTLWMKEYNQPGDTSYLFSSAELSDSSIISVGYAYYDNGNQLYSRSFILKTDKNGNYKWHKYLWNSTANYAPIFGKLLNINNKDFIVTGSYQNNTPGVKSFLLRFDTDGVIQYNKLIQHSNYLYSGLNDIIILKNGSYLSCGSVQTNMIQSVLYWRPWLYNFDPLTGNMINSKLYAQEKRNGHEFSVLYSDTSTGNVYATGLEWFLPQNYDKVTFYKFNSNLDSLLTRYFDDGFGGTSACGSFQRSKDLGFALAVQMYPLTSTAKFWLIKLDSSGCNSSQSCESSTLSIREVQANNFITVFPNPAGDLLHIDCSNINKETNLKIKIFDVVGNLILKKEFFDGYNISIDISIADLNKGAYFLLFLIDEKVQVVKKIIKN